MTSVRSHQLKGGRAGNLTRSLGSFTTFQPGHVPAPLNSARGPGPGVGGGADAPAALRGPVRARQRRVVPGGPAPPPR